MKRRRPHPDFGGLLQSVKSVDEINGVLGALADPELSESTWLFSPRELAALKQKREDLMRQEIAEAKRK